MLEQQRVIGCHKAGLQTKLFCNTRGRRRYLQKRRPKDTIGPSRKSWTIATRNKGLLQHLNLKCQKNHPRGKCEAGEAAHTSRYTEAFARKVVDSLVENEAWSLVVQELGRTTHGEILAAEDAEEDEECEAEVQEGERRRIEGLIQHIHKNTGHGSLKNLVEALRRRGARPEVLRIAKAWSCPTCTERKAPVPRRWATLDTLSPKFEVLELDAGT